MIVITWKAFDGASVAVTETLDRLRADSLQSG
jgi:hypothetical protein